MNITDRKGFYAVIFEALNSDMQEKGIISENLKHDKSYVVSRPQYYYIKKIAEGKEAPILSNKRLNELCDYLNIEFQDLYKYNLNSNK